MARKNKSVIVVNTEAALMRRLGVGTVGKTGEPVKWSCHLRMSAISGTSTERPAMVEMAIRVARGPSKT